MEQQKVLVVDDDDALRDMMAAHLRRQGYHAESAPDGFQALQILKTNGPFAVLITDLMMPFMSGLQLLRQARELDPHLEAVVITAAASVASAIAAMREDGAYDYLTKPLETINELSAAVERAVAYRQLQLDREALQARSIAEARRLQLLMANISDAILSADANDRLTVINPAATRLLGQDILLGGEALTSLPKPLAALIANWQAAGGQQPATIEIDWPAGVTQMVSLTPIIGSQNAFEGWVMAVRDITHLKQLDDLKMQMLTETANKIQLPLAQAMNALTELSAAAEVKSERMANIVYRLTKAWGRIQEWAADLHELVRYEAGDTQLAEVNLSSVLAETLKVLPQDVVRSKNLKLDLSLPPDLPSVHADPSLLHKALSGLLNRAILRSAPASTVRLTGRVNRGQIWIDISDGGSPIADSELPHVFDRSFMGASPNYDSTGLELAIAKTVIDKTGGQVWVRSQEPTGSIVTVCLPAATQAVPK